MYKLIVLDIDGTLTNSEKRITDRTREAILEIQRRGLKAVIASGRPTCGIIPLAKDLCFDRYGSYILSYNGGRIIDCSSWEPVFERAIPPQTLRRARDFAKAHGAEIITYEGNEILSETDSDEFMEIEARINGMTVRNIGNIAEYVDFDVPKCLLLGDGDRMGALEAPLAAELGGEVNVFRSEPYFLEVMPAGIDKARSLERLLNILGLSREEMIACGDGFNDLTMIKYAGLGVAMDNAQQAVKDAADFITLSNNNDGIAYVIDRFMSA